MPGDRSPSLAAAGPARPGPGDAVVLTFPGQGSQGPSAGTAWQGTSGWRLVDRAAELTGRDLARLLLDAKADELRDTGNAQMVVFLGSILALSALADAGVSADVCLGHSVGEFAALVAAEVLSFDDAVLLVADRAAAMRTAAEHHDGAMAAVLGLDDALVESACDTNPEAWIANYNSPGQVVVAGSRAGLAVALECCHELGSPRALPLDVAGAFHTPLMASASEPLADALRSVHLADPSVPVVANVDAEVHRRADSWRQLPLEQLCHPVRWWQSLDRAARLVGSQRPCFVEVGPGGVLTGLARRSVPGARTFALAEPAAAAELAELVGQSAQDRAPAGAGLGEWVGLAERLITSPAVGGFYPTDPAGDFEGTVVDTGTVIGTVAEEEVRVFCSGWLTRMLVRPGERVRTGQPLAVVRSV